jgi:predicted phosphoribosyltransferase
MIQNDQELSATQVRIQEFQHILTQLRVTARPEEFFSVASGYLRELERMQEDVLEYLRRHASQPAGNAASATR